MAEQRKRKWKNVDEAVSYVRDIFLMGKKKKYARAKSLLRQCAERDNVIAQYQLYAIEYNKIAGEDENDSPLFWCVKAAEKGYAPAQYDLALHYLYGDCVKKDIVIAIEWMEKAAELNYKEAMRKLSTLYSAGTIVKKNITKANYWKARFNGICDETYGMSREREDGEKDLDDELFDIHDIEQVVTAILSSAIKIDSFRADFLNNDEKKLFLLDNMAELAFVSKILLEKNIKHDVIKQSEEGSKILLCDIETLPERIQNMNVYVSDLLVEKGCDINNKMSWEKLSRQSELKRLLIPRKEIYSIENNGRTWWGYREPANDTYICIGVKDLIIFNDLSEANQKVTLINDMSNKTFQIMTSQNAKLIGQTKPDLYEVLSLLVDMEEIDYIPTLISGITLKEVEDEMMVLGVGKMEFIEE